MKTCYLISSLLFISMISRSQYYDDRFLNYNLYIPYEIYGKWKTSNFISSNHILKLETVSCRYRHGKARQDSVSERTVVTFDSAGRLMEMHRYEKNSKNGRSRKDIYSGDKVTERFYYGKNGKVEHHKKYTYDSFGNITEYLSLAHNDKKIISRTVSVFDSNRTLETTCYRKGGKKVSVHYVYLYSPGKSTATVYTYNGNGKLLHVSTEACDLDTRKLVAHKDTSYFCIQKEYDEDSNRIITSRSLTSRNKLWKYVQVYNRKGRLIKMTGYNEHNRISYIYNYYPDSAYLVRDYMYFNKKGETSYTHNYIYDSQWRCTEEYITEKKGVTWRATYTFNEKGLTSRMMNFGKKNRINRAKYYYYTY